METEQPTIQAKLNPVLYVVSIVTILSTVALMVTFYYLKFIQGNPPIVYLDEPIPVVNKELRHGDPLILNIKRCVDSNLPPLTMNLTFQDGLEFNVPEKEILDYKSGCTNGFVTLLNIPKTLPAGEYNLFGKATFDVNFLADRTVEFFSEKFVVLPD